MDETAGARVGADGGRFARAVGGCVRIAEDGVQERVETVALEVPFAVSVDGAFCDVLSCTPRDLEDLALGYAFAKGIVEGPADVAGIAVDGLGGCWSADVRLREGAGFDAEALRLGLPGAASAEGGPAALPPYFPARMVHLPDGEPFDREAVWKAAEGLAERQRMHWETGATHAAAFVDRDGRFVCMREDVGRHNAVDKLIGALLRAGVEPQDGFAYLSSRCALELVNKLARFGVAFVATVSAPTSAVLEYAAEANVTLAAFARGNRFTLYTHPERIR